MPDEYIKKLVNHTIAAIRAAADEINKSNCGIRIPPCSVDVRFSAFRHDFPFPADITFTVPCELYDTEEKQPRHDEDGGWKSN